MHHTFSANAGQYLEGLKGWMKPVHDLVLPFSEGYFAGALDFSRLPFSFNVLSMLLVVLLGIWKEGDHRDWNAIRLWAKSLRQTTKYPWDGEVKIEVEVVHPQILTLHLRVPGWCEGWQLRINDVPVTNMQPQANGYLTIEREWQSGDVVMYEMEMPIQTVWAHPAVRHLQGRMAIQRGPIVYCLEGVDHGKIALDRIALDPQQLLSSEFGIEYIDDLLGGICILRGQGTLIDENGWDDALYRHKQPSSMVVAIMAIPYYAWGNRDPGEMRIWFRGLP